MLEERKLNDWCINSMSKQRKFLLCIFGERGKLNDRYILHFMFHSLTQWKFRPPLMPRLIGWINWKSKQPLFISTFKPVFTNRSRGKVSRKKDWGGEEKGKSFLFFLKSEANFTLWRKKSKKMHSNIQPDSQKFCGFSFVFFLPSNFPRVHFSSRCKNANKMKFGLFPLLLVFQEENHE